MRARLGRELIEDRPIGDRSEPGDGLAAEQADGIWRSGKPGGVGVGGGEDERLVERVDAWREEDLDGLEYPVMVKPRRGSGARSIHLAHDAEQARFFIAYVEEPTMVQRAMNGPEISIDCLGDRDGRCLYHRAHRCDDRAAAGP